MEEAMSDRLQEIEKFKQKIAAYRDTVMTLKMGSSLEDYLVMKSEFDVIKTQISHIEGLDKSVDEKQHLQNEVYEEQIKQFSLQLGLLNQTVEEMNQEILSISNQIILSKNEGISENNPPIVEEETDHDKSTSIWPPLNNQVSSIPSRPSYIQLRELVDRVVSPQSIQNNLAPVDYTEYEGSQNGESFFNQRYFQSINTHPDHIYNGLYKNTLGKVSLHYQDYDDNQKDLTSVPGNSQQSAPLPNETLQMNVPSPIQNLPEDLAPVAEMAEVFSESVSTSTTVLEEVGQSVADQDQINTVLEEVGQLVADQDQINTVLPIEEMGNQEESLPVEHKKKKNTWLSMIFNK